jgi:hypothetical protein
MRGKKRPFSALIACFAILGMIAGGAVAFPARFHAIVSKAQLVLRRGGTADARDPAAHRDDASTGGNGPAGSPPDRCEASISGILQDPPGTQDVRGLQHAIAVVEADCQKNPNARGLLTALTHMLANARNADHPSHAGGNGKGGGNGNGNGVGHDPPGGGHGHGHAYGHGVH